MGVYWVLKPKSKQNHDFRAEDLERHIHGDAVVALLICVPEGVSLDGHNTPTKSPCKIPLGHGDGRGGLSYHDEVVDIDGGGCVGHLLFSFWRIRGHRLLPQSTYIIANMGPQHKGLF